MPLVSTLSLGSQPFGLGGDCPYVLSKGFARILFLKVSGSPAGCFPLLTPVALVCAEVFPKVKPGP